MATAKELSQQLNISESKFSGFIEVNRKDICGDNMLLGVHVLARFVGIDFFDIKLCVDDGRFIIARFRRKSLYFVGYTKSTDKKKTWYTLSELEPPSSSSSASSSSSKEKKEKPGKFKPPSSSSSASSSSGKEGKEKLKKFKRVSIKDSNTMDWDEKFTDYSGDYTGAYSLLAIAGGGGGDEKKQSVQLTDMRLGRETIAEAVYALLKYDPTNKDDSEAYALCAKSFARIALSVAEPLRYELLKEMISAEWGDNGYKICEDGVFMIKNWENLSAYVRTHEGKEEDDEILKDSLEIMNFLGKHGVKLGSHLRKICGIIMESDVIESKEASKRAMENHPLNRRTDPSSHYKSKGKRSAKK